MEFLSQTYVALRGPQGAPQTASETITKLADRLSPSTLLADRRASVLSLKNLSRSPTHRPAISSYALPGLLEVLQNDAAVDPDTGRAVLETLHILCDVTGASDPPSNPNPNANARETQSWESRDLAQRNIDFVLATPEPTYKLFELLGDPAFYTRFSACVLLCTLLRARPGPTQGYFLKAPCGPGTVVGLLEDRREMLRSESLPLLSALIHSSPEIQKLLAFNGIFEHLFTIVTSEGGLDGGPVVCEVLGVVDGLLRYNGSNLAYFRESSLPSLLCRLLFFDPNLNLDGGEQVPQEFALQFWTGQKEEAVGRVLGIMGMVLGAKGSGVKESQAFTRMLIEMALASNAPTRLKVQSLSLLPSSASSLLPSLILTPYTPVPDTAGEEWDRLEPATGIDALLDLVVHGEYNGMSAGVGSRDAEGRRKEGLELRAGAVGVFENFLREDNIREAIVSGMLPPPSDDPTQTNSKPRSPLTPLLYGLILPLSSSSSSSSSSPSSSSSYPSNANAPHTQTLDRSNVTSFQFATILFAHLIRHAPQCKALARGIVPPPLNSDSADAIGGGAAGGGGGGNFFVPADGAPPAVPQAEEKEAEEEEDEDEAPTLLQLLTEHLSLAFLSRGRAQGTNKSGDEPTPIQSGMSSREQREWDRVIVASLALLGQWLWEEPKAVREFLEGGGLSLLVEQLNQPPSESDVVIPGLCAFVLGICYEFNREPGEITRESMSPLLSRLGVDNLVSLTTRLRDDERIKAVSPDSWVLPCPTPRSLDPGYTPMYEGEGEVWFDWAFVDFWKSNCYTVQRGLVADPAAPPTVAAQSGEESVLVASLRDIITKQTSEIQALHSQLRELSSSLESAKEDAVASGASQGQRFDEERTALQTQLAALQAQLTSEREKSKEAEKEQEDLLVLLDELSTKRARDKERMREKGMEVSEDEGDDDDDEEEGEAEE